MLKRTARRRRLIAFKGSTNMDGCHRRRASAANDVQCSVSSCENKSKEEVDPLSEDNICYASIDYTSLSIHASEHSNSEQKSQGASYSKASLSHKYQPRRFEDIVGHDIVIRVISTAALKRRVANLYLFHGPNGTGKISTARIFAMALNCGSTSLGKPCWNCRGCSRSLYMMELCSGSRTSGFHQISTLLQNTSFAQTVPGFKVCIIEESQSLTEEAWDELLGMLGDEHRTNLVFVLIAVDANAVPKSIASRCHKFYFPRLKNMDVTLKLARIVAQEDIEIEKEAMELIVTKADGSLREAENILDQLTLLGPRITCSVVQQFVGLVPQDKLIKLLEAVLCGNTEKTVRITRELTTLGFETQALMLQLASLIADLLSGDAIHDAVLDGPSYHNGQEKSGLPFSNAYSDSLCYALKSLVEAQKQPKSSIEHITWTYSTLLQIATRDYSYANSSEVFLPKSNKAYPRRRSWENCYVVNETTEEQSSDARDLDIIDRTNSCLTEESTNRTGICGRKAVEKGSHLACMRDLRALWLKILESIQTEHLKEFLSQHVKLASVTVSTANAIVHLMFKTPQDKMAAKSSEESILRALRSAIGCPVVLNMSLQPINTGIIQNCTTSSNEVQHQLGESCGCRRQQHNPCLSKPDQAANPEPLPRQSLSTKYPPSDINSRLFDLNDGLLKARGRSTKETEATETGAHNVLLFSGLTMQEENQSEAFVDPSRNFVPKDQAQLGTAHILRKERSRHQWLSSSAIQQSDASVKQYSQDVFFENANKGKGIGARKDTKIERGANNIHKDNYLQDSTANIGLFRSWSCKDAICQRMGKP